MDRATFGVKDASLIKTKALPAAPGSIQTDGLDLGLVGARGARLDECELKISAPILTTTELPDTKTVKYDVQMDTEPLFGTVKTIAKEVLVQTGAGGAGAAAAAVRFRLSSECEQYIRVKATQDTVAADQSDKSVTIELLM